MTFANASAFLLFLLFIPLAAVKIAGDYAARRRLRRVAGTRLLGRLRRGGWRGRDVLIFLLESLGLAFLIIAWARPQWGHTEREVMGSGRSIIIAIDTSRSMLATDLTPDRLTRARLAAQDLITSLPNDRIGLIAFAGRAFLQAPLTTDHEALLETLAQFDVELIPRGGSNLAEPIEVACEAFEKSGTASHALILFSDGDATEGQGVAAARKARDQNVMVVTVGVGTLEGSLLPDRSARTRAGFIEDAQGRPVRSRLDDRSLESIARETGGLYLNIGSTSSLKERIEVILGKLDRSATQAMKERRQPIDRYRWALVPALLCLAGAFLVRMGRPMGGGPFFLPWSAPARTATAVIVTMAMITGTVPVRGESSAPTGSTGNPWRHYQAGEFDAAMDGFSRALDRKPEGERGARLEFGRAAAAFHLKDYDTAVESFGRALATRDRSLQAEAEFNLANSLAARAKAVPKARGRLDRMIATLTQALAHYDAALEINPGHAEARFNRDAVQKYLDELKKYKQELKQRQKSGKRPGQKREGQRGPRGQQPAEGSDGQEGESGQSGENGEEGDEEGEEGESDEAEGGEDGESPGSGDDPQQDGRSGSGQDDQQQPAPEGDEEARRGQQAQEGRIEARNGGQGGTGDDQRSPSEDSSTDRRRNRASGFSRSEARALLRALSDEDHVRPLTERAPREGTYKNW